MVVDEMMLMLVLMVMSGGELNMVMLLLLLLMRVERRVLLLLSMHGAEIGETVAALMMMSKGRHGRVVDARRVEQMMH